MIQVSSIDVWNLLEPGVQTHFPGLAEFKSGRDKVLGLPIIRTFFVKNLETKPYEPQPNIRWALEFDIKIRPCVSMEAKKTALLKTMVS